MSNGSYRTSSCLINEDFSIVEWCNVAWFIPINSDDYYDFFTFGNKQTMIAANDAASEYKPSIIGLF